MRSTPVVSDQDLERVYAIDAVVQVFSESEIYKFPVKRGVITGWNEKTVCVDYVPYSRQGNTFVVALPLSH